jgi:glutathione S-transferase
MLLEDGALSRHASPDVTSGGAAAMKLYDCATAPSPRRVRIFLAEKGIAVPTQQVDLRAGEHLQPAFLAINPDATVPVLELDSGVRITDAVAICQYFEDVQPNPPLCGVGPEERAVVAAWQRRIERDGFYAMMEAFRNATPGLKNRAVPGPVDYAQIPALAERGRARVAAFFASLDAHLADRAFIAGPRYSIADITALITVDWSKWIKLLPPENLRHLWRWHAGIAARPSATA